MLPHRIRYIALTVLLPILVVALFVKFRAPLLPSWAEVMLPYAIWLSAVLISVIGIDYLAFLENDTQEAMSEKQGRNTILHHFAQLAIGSLCVPVALYFLFSQDVLVFHVIVQLTGLAILDTGIILLIRSYMRSFRQNSSNPIVGR
jgi:hypothetical protein